MNLENLINTKYYSVGNLDAPKIVFEENDIKKYIASWCGNKTGISLKFGKLLAGFGFCGIDIITLKNLQINQEEVSFNYLVNGIHDPNNRITLKFTNLICTNAITISNDNEEVTCFAYVIDRKNISLIKKQYRKKLKNNCLYKRTFDNDSTSFEVISDNMKFELKLQKNPQDLTFEHLLVQDEKALQQYLENLDLSRDITDIYKEIISYLGDINSYHKFSLTISLNSGKKDQITDMISLTNGEFEQFKTNKNGRIITLNKDGSYSYEADTSIAKVVVESKHDKNTYGFIYENEDKFPEKDILLSDIMTDAKNALEEVKKKTRKMIKSGGNVNGK